MYSFRYLVLCCTLIVLAEVSGGSVYADLLGHWTFDVNGNDSSGNNYHAVLNGGATIDLSDKKVGSGSLRLAATGNSYAEVTASAMAGHPLNLAGTDYTIAFWVKETPAAGWQRFVNKDDGNDFDGGYSVWRQPNDWGGLTHNPYGNRTDALTFPLDENEWHHMAVVFDSVADTLTTYYDGQATQTYGGITPTLATDTPDFDPLWFGGMPVHGQNFRGWLDDIRIYNHALSANDVSELFAPTAAPVPEPSSVVAFALCMVVGLGAVGLRRKYAKSAVPDQK